MSTLEDLKKKVMEPVYMDIYATDSAEIKKGHSGVEYAEVHFYEPKMQTMFNFCEYLIVNDFTTDAPLGMEAGLITCRVFKKQ